MAEIRGFKELSKQLSAMGRRQGGKALRSAVTQAMLPALQGARNRAPVGDPGKTQYPRKTHKGRLVSVGFSQRNVKRKTIVSQDKRFAVSMVGVDQEAFPVVQFLELGTSTIPKRPWLVPAFEAAIPQIDKRLRDRLKKNIDRAAK